MASLHLEANRSAPAVGPGLRHFEIADPPASHEAHGLNRALRDGKENRAKGDYRGKKQQVPPLRFAPVGMTILLQGQVFFAEALAATTETLAATTELSSRPERSVVEGPAVSFPGTLLSL